MLSPRGSIGLALAVLSFLLCACGGGPAETASEDDRASGKENRKLTWEPVERLAGGWAADAATTLAPDGTATVVWGGPKSGLSRQAAEGKPWGTPKPIPHTKLASTFSAAAAADGTVTAVWDSDESYTTGTYSIWSATLPSGGGAWSPAVKVATGPYEDIGLVNWDLAVGPSGGAVLSWVDEDNSMQVASRPAGGEWSEPTSMKNSWTTLNAPVTIDAEGLSTVAYLRDNAELLTLAQSSERGWADPIELDEPLGYRPYDIAAAGDGEVVVVWQEKDRTFVTARLVAGALKKQQSLPGAGERAVEMVVEGADDGSARFVWRTAGDVERCAASISLLVVSWATSKSSGGPHDARRWRRLRCRWPATGGGTPSLRGPEPTPADWMSLFARARTHGWVRQEVVPKGQGPGCENEPTALVSETGSALVTWADAGSDPYGMESALLARRGTLE